LVVVLQGGAKRGQIENYCRYCAGYDYIKSPYTRTSQSQTEIKRVFPQDDENYDERADSIIDKGS